MEKLILVIAAVIGIIIYLWIEDRNECTRWRTSYYQLDDTFQKAVRRHSALIAEKDLIIAEKESLNISLQDRCSNAELTLETIEDDYKKLTESNLTSMPWLAGMMADFMTYEMEAIAKKTTGAMISGE